jgi:Zn-dependent protease with chaperone function
MVLKILVVLLPFLIFSLIAIGKLIDLVKLPLKNAKLEYKLFYISLFICIIVFIFFLPDLVDSMLPNAFNSWVGVVLIAIISLGCGYNFTRIIFNLIIPTLDENDIIKVYLKNFGKKEIIKKQFNLSDKLSNANIEKINNYLVKNGFKNVVCVEERQAGYATTYIDPEDKQHVIYIYTGCIGMAWEKLISVVGHELGHIIRRNNTKIDNIRRFFGGIVIFIIPITSLIALYICEGNIHNIIGTLLLLFLGLLSIASFLYMIVYFSFNNIRFWLQVDEIYCDRKACELPEVKAQNLISVFEELQYHIDNSAKKKWFDNYYIKYYLVLEHPCLKYRIKLLKNYKKWSWFEYIKHFNVMFVWLITGYGWIGE